MKYTLPLLLGLSAVFIVDRCLRADKVDFNRDVRPILSDKCFQCHGPDANERANDLRLDDKLIAFGRLESGIVAIVPGRPHDSEVVKRLRSKDPDIRMPPEHSGKSLSSEEIEAIERWIAIGAPWSDHWSFVSPSRPKLPFISNRDWVSNPIDAFVLRKLRELSLTPSVFASKHRFIRRATFDLTGLPPSKDEVLSFLADTGPDAHIRLVDRLLDSPRFGEHQARYWLDAARYGDTHGLHLDNERSIWPYRTWVINAINKNMPFDEFTIDQLAGDLRKNPTRDQLIATGFNRCNVTTSEGGSIAQEYLVRYAVDRVETTSTVWLGMTMGCAVCHDHKFDPISQKEFYQLFSYFYSLTEKAMDGNALLPPPSVKAPTYSQRKQETEWIATVEKYNASLKRQRLAAMPRFQRWLKNARSTTTAPPIPGDYVIHVSFDEVYSGHVGLGSDLRGKIVGSELLDAGKISKSFRFNGATHIDAGDIASFERTQPFTITAWVYRTSDQAGTVVSKMDDDEGFRGYDLYIANGLVYVHLIHRWDSDAIRINTIDPIGREKWQHITVTCDGSGKASGLQILVDGDRRDTKITHDSLTGSLRNEQPLRIGRRSKLAPFRGMIDELRIYDRVVTPEELRAITGTDPIRRLLSSGKAELTKDELSELLEHYLVTNEESYRRLLNERNEAERELRKLRNSFPSTLVMKELVKPRTAHVLVRGQYDQPADSVERGVPAALSGPASTRPADRLELAKWLVDSRNPLTARVIVNRIWQQYFGTGIVKTSEDFGSQGEWPSHPELLDWLSTEFIQSGWNVKHIHRLIATSSTYRQSSKVSDEAYSRDPENRLLARGPRFRMDAEMVRDTSLAVSGLFVERIGGKSVKPYQPDGLWYAVGYTSSNTARFQQDHGANLYRRSMYTFWKRTSPPPSMQILDAPSREVCTVRRPRTNTPAAALTLMNDVQFVEAARRFAQRIVQEGGADDASRIRFAYLVATSRYPDDFEITAIQRLVEKTRTRFEKDIESATTLLSVGESERDASIPAAEQAAWTIAASTILNLDEVVTKQ